MEFTWKVLVFERRIDRELHWHTLGLGKGLAVHVSARHLTRVHRRLQEALQRRVDKRSNLALGTSRFPQARLKAPSLELVLKGETRRKISGPFSMVSETVSTGAGRYTLVYPPLRPWDWLPVDDDDATDALVPHLSLAWADLSPEDLSALRPGRRDRLRLVTVELKKLSLLRRLRREQQEGPDWAGAGRRREDVLDDLATDESDDLRFAGPDYTPKIGRPREPYRKRLLRRLAEPMTPTVLLGPPGCGKSTLIRHGAWDLMTEDGFFVHRELGRCRRIWRLSGRRLIAGMSYVGEWEQRCLDLLDEIRDKRREKQRPILWVDDLHAFSQIGQSRDSERCLADVFRGPVARGELMIVGEASPEAWQVLEIRAPAFAALFQPLWVRPTDNDEALGLLLHEARKLEAEPDVEILPSAYRVLVETTRAIYGDDAHPGRSLGILRSLGDDQFWSSDDAGLKVDAAAAIHRLAEETGLPTVLLEPTKPLDPAQVERRFAAGVMGQNEAVSAVRGLIATLKAGLADSGRPYGVFLFTGPTGTGKTELAKYLATWLYGRPDRLLRFDMGEHGDPWSTARLVGDRVRPEGLLTEAVRSRPFSVVLLDEIEKAHPSVLNLLLQVFDEGRLSDAAGRVADFSHCVVIMTSNLGADGRSRVGFGADPNAVVHEVRRAVEAFFPPELHNRIDRIVPFRPLTPTVARAIAEAELKRLLGRRGLVRRGVFVTVDPAVIERIAGEGFDSRQGARAVKRYLDRHVAGALAAEVAAGTGSKMHAVRLFAPCRPAPGKPFAVRVNAFGEAPALVGRSALEPILNASPSERPALVVQPLLERVEALLSEELPARREQVSLNASGDQLILLDEMRTSLETLREALDKEAERLSPEEGELLEAEKFGRVKIRDSWETGVPALSLRAHDPRALERRALSPDRLVEMAAEVHLLSGLLTESARAGSSDEVLVELLTVGDADARGDMGSRLAIQPPGLIAWLVDAYVGEPSAFLLAFASDAGDGSGDEVGAALRRVLARRPSRVVLHLQGLALWARLAAEAGTHQLLSDREPPELVRVRVLNAEQGPREHLDALTADHVRYLKALSTTPTADASELPDDPEHPLPLIRRIRFDPWSASDARSRMTAAGYGLKSTPAAECRVEDVRLCMEVHLRTRRLADALRPLRLRLQTWTPALSVDSGESDGR